MIGRSGLVTGGGGGRKVFGCDFAKSNGALAKNFFGALAELLLHFRTGIAGAHRLQNHDIQAASAAEKSQFVGMLFDRCREEFEVKSVLVLRAPWRR